MSEASSVTSPGEGPRLVYCLGKRNPHIFKELMGFETRDSHQQVCMDILTAAGGMCGTKQICQDFLFHRMTRVTLFT